MRFKNLNITVTTSSRKHLNLDEAKKMALRFYAVFIQIYPYRRYIAKRYAQESWKHFLTLDCHQKVMKVILHSKQHGDADLWQNVLCLLPPQCGVS